MNIDGLEEGLSGGIELGGAAEAGELRRRSGGGFRA